MNIIIATRSAEKMVEVKQILGELPVHLVSLSEINKPVEINAQGSTFEERAIEKARTVCDATSEWVIAEDGGLCIQALGGQLEIGSQTAQEQLIIDTLQKITALPAESRQAYGEYAVALVAPDGQEWVFNGRVNGQVINSVRGEALPGCPYDQLFIPEGSDQTLAEMNALQRQGFSFRGQALNKLKRFLIQAELLEAEPEPVVIPEVRSQEQPA